MPRNLTRKRRIKQSFEFGALVVVGDPSAFSVTHTAAWEVSSGNPTKILRTTYIGRGTVGLIVSVMTGSPERAQMTIVANGKHYRVSTRYLSVIGDPCKSVLSRGTV